MPLNPSRQPLSRRLVHRSKGFSNRKFTYRSSESIATESRYTNRFLKTLRLSNQLAKALSVASVYKRIADGLTRKAKPLAKLHLLRIIKVFCEYNPHYDNSAEWFELATVVEDLGRHDEAILVRQVSIC